VPQDPGDEPASDLLKRIAAERAGRLSAVVAARARRRIRRPCAGALRPLLECYYSSHMATMKLKVARIGNSRGVRLPAASLRRYRIGETVVMEERSEGILLRPTGPVVEKLSWEETAREMAASREDWSVWDTAAADGLDDPPWQADRKGRVAEPSTRYAARPGPGKRR